MAQSTSQDFERTRRNVLEQLNAVMDDIAAVQVIVRDPYTDQVYVDVPLAGGVYLATATTILAPVVTASAAVIAAIGRVKIEIVRRDHERVSVVIDQSSEKPPVIEVEVPPVAEAEAPAVQPDDLTAIEGIGEKYQQALRAAGIATFTQLSESTLETLEAAARSAGMNKSASMKTWAEQAAYVARGEWEALEELQQRLRAGTYKD